MAGRPRFLLGNPTRQTPPFLHRMDTNNNRNRHEMQVKTCEVALISPRGNRSIMSPSAIDGCCRMPRRRRSCLAAAESAAPGQDRRGGGRSQDDSRSQRRPSRRRRHRPAGARIFRRSPARRASGHRCAASAHADGSPPTNEADIRLGGAAAPDEARSSPQPRPGDATGLALSGGGIRSASFCLGALQALEVHGAIDGLDYLSTVSGGGYTGACMTAAMSSGGGFPFQIGADPRDSVAVGHLRNYSNYLLPRDRSPARNFADNATIILRGLVANALLTLMILLLLALLTIAAYPDKASLGSGSFLPRLSDAALSGGWFDRLAHANAIG